MNYKYIITIVQENDDSRPNSEILDFFEDLETAQKTKKAFDEFQTYLFDLESELVETHGEIDDDWFEYVSSPDIENKREEIKKKYDLEEFEYLDSEVYKSSIVGIYEINKIE